MERPRFYDPPLSPLAPKKKHALQALRQSKPRKRAQMDIEQLIKDWDLIANAAEMEGFWWLTEADIKSDRKLKELDEAIEAASSAAERVGRFFYLWNRHRGCFDVNGETDRRWGATVTRELLQLRKVVVRQREGAAAVPRTGPTLGRPRTLVRFLQDALADYFRLKGWPVSTSPVGEFANAAMAVCGSRSISPTRLRALRDRKHRPLPSWWDQGPT